MYKTMNYARITCSDCGKEVQILLPGKPFNGIKECECRKKVVRKRTVTKKDD